MSIVADVALVMPNVPKTRAFNNSILTTTQQVIRADVLRGLLKLCAQGMGQTYV